LELKVQKACRDLADKMLIHSAHDCSEGGLAVTLAECCFSSLGREGIGAKVSLESGGLSDAALLFGETPSRIVVSFAAEDLDKVKETVGDCPFAVIGEVADDILSIDI